MLLYLIRHAHPASPDAERRCISRTDSATDALGKIQARRLETWLETHPVRAVYTSPLQRAVQTARQMAQGKIPVFTDERLTEMCVGAWEGLSFDEISARWPKLYARRGLHMGTTAPPDGESFLTAGKRMQDFLLDLPNVSGDVAVVSHGGIMRGWLCPLLGKSPDDVLTIPQPWGGVTVVRMEDGRFSVLSVGCMPFPVPNDAEIKAMYALYDTPPEVRAHCEAVADCALRIARESGAQLRQDELYAAALLHDLCRASGREHPQKAAKALKRLGYPRLAEMVSRHHDLEDKPSEEAEVLYLADKLVQGVSPVSLRERFEQSRRKCGDEAALSAWKARYDAALAMERKYLHGRIL